LEGAAETRKRALLKMETLSSCISDEDTKINIWDYISVRQNAESILDRLKYDEKITRLNFWKLLIR
jgi:hypothetical protein